MCMVVVCVCVAVIAMALSACVTRLNARLYLALCTCCPTRVADSFAVNSVVCGKRYVAEWKTSGCIYITIVNQQGWQCMYNIG